MWGVYCILKTPQKITILYKVQFVLQRLDFTPRYVLFNRFSDTTWTLLALEITFFWLTVTLIKFQKTQKISAKKLIHIPLHIAACSICLHIILNLGHKSYCVKKMLRFYLPSFLIVLLICNPPFYIFLFFYCLTLHIIKLIRKRRNLKPWFQDLNCFKDKKRWYRICKFYKNNFTSEY